MARNSDEHPGASRRSENSPLFSTGPRGLRGARMAIAWDSFTPWHALAGGLLIGCASALFILGNGRIAGIAGIVASPLRAVLTGTSLAPERTRLWFIGGLVAAPWVWRLFAPLPALTIDVGALVL